MALREQVLAMLGADADRPASLATEVCLSAAARSLRGIVAEQRFARENALALLAVDALTTFAYEHASEAALGLRDHVSRGTRMLAAAGETA